MVAMYFETTVVRKSVEAVCDYMRAKRDEIVAVFKWRLYVMKRWMYVMVLATYHKFVATNDKMVAVCNEMVDVRNGVGYIS